MTHRMRFIITVLIAAGLAGCGKHPDDGAKHTRLKVEENAANGGLHPSGRPEAPLIDPTKKAVVVLAAPSAPQLVARQEARVEADRAKTESQIHDLMDGYTSNMQNPTAKRKYEQQIAQQLDTYKRHSLELYQLRRNAAAVANQ